MMSRKRESMPGHVPSVATPVAFLPFNFSVPAICFFPLLKLRNRVEIAPSIWLQKLRENKDRGHDHHCDRQNLQPIHGGFFTFRAAYSPQPQNPATMIT